MGIDRADGGTWGLLVATGLALVACAAPPAPDASPGPSRDGLYRQMRACIAEARPAPPCLVVDQARGFVVIKDDSPEKPDGYLIVPTTDVTGIEDPRVLQAPVAAFWGYGWEVGGQLLERPPADIGLAINSKAGRTQDLLHIHISCVVPTLREALAAARIGPQWASEPFVEFRGHGYNARKVAALDPSPFLLLADLPGAREDMAAQSLAVIGSADGGFYLLTDATEPGVVAEAEELLDQACS